MNILGISGKKQSGKSSLANFLVGMEMKSLNIISDFALTEAGMLEVPTIQDGEIGRGIFDYNLPNEELQRYLAENIWDHIKVYSLADPLKYGVCMGLLGMSYEQCFGTDEEKNTPTKIRWENVPGIVDPEDIRKELHDSLMGCQLHEPGPMTAREVMQHIGTNIFRRMLPDIWIDATIQKIRAETPELAIISDVRFPNEVEGIQKAGGKVIRLTFNPHNSDHKSETALDNYEGFDAVIDNANLSMHEKNMEAYKILKSWNFLQYELS